MLQRAMIAMALSCRPKVLIADEPTTALDVTIQAQILQLIKNMQAEIGMGLIMITHDLGVIAETVDRVLVMYGGKVMEEGPVQRHLRCADARYTQSLLAQPHGRQTAGALTPEDVVGRAGCSSIRGSVARAIRVKQRTRVLHEYARLPRRARRSTWYMPRKQNRWARR